MMKIPLKGNLKQTSFPRLLADLNRNRETGTLSVRTPLFTKSVYLIKGDAIFASSTYEDDRLGEMLIKAGKITMEQYDESVKLLKRTKKRQGAILVDLGYLTPKDLFWGVKYQVVEIIYSLFQLEDGEYEFFEGEIPHHEVITLKMSMGNLIYEGVKRIDNWTRIRKEMPDINTVLKLSGDPVTLFQDLELSPSDKKMLSLVDGKKTIKELIDDAWISSFEGMKILYVLWSIGVVEERKKEAGKAERKKEVPSFSKGEEHFKQGVEAFKKGRFREAADSFRSAIKAEPGNTRYWSYLSLSLCKLPDKLTDAEKALSEAIRLEPSNADYYVNLGLIHMRQGKKKMAQKQFNKALAIDPKNIKAKKGLEKTKG
jgi:tetratricopeptide (TPR) repeat protein